jgi:hypothetical protein
VRLRSAYPAVACGRLTRAVAPSNCFPLGLRFEVSVASDPRHPRRHGLAFDLPFAFHFTNAQEGKLQFTNATGGKVQFIFSLLFHLNAQVTLRINAQEARGAKEARDAQEERDAKLKLRTRG